MIHFNCAAKRFEFKPYLLWQGWHRPFIKGLVFFLAVSPLGLSAATEKPATVQDLRYGVALYHYFQNEYQNALTELLITEQRGGVQGHGDAGQLMRGGLNLALDMEPQASEVFERLIDQNTPLSVRNAAWFYLGKLRYRQGNWQGAELALERVSDGLPEQMAGELQSLHINLAIKQQDYARAEQLFGQQKQLTPWLPYIYYNLAAAHIRDGNSELGVGYFDALAELTLTDEEHRALRDKALTAAGYSLMLQQDYQGAMSRFIKVRYHSPLIQKALLGYGWAAMELEKYPVALSSWQRLGEHSGFDSSVQEALLAIPHIYEKLDAPVQALEAYIDAESSYTDQLDEIRYITDSLHSDDLLAALKLSNSLSEFSDPDSVESSQLDRLADFLSLQPLQNHAGDLQKLLAMREQLQQWQQKLDIFKHLLEQRQQSRGEKLQQIEQNQFSQQLQQLMASGDQRASELQRIINEGDAIALDSGDTAELWQRVERAERNLALFAESPVFAKETSEENLPQQFSEQELNEYREQLRRYRGQLLWNAHEQFPDNLWQRKKALQQFQNQLIETVENYRHLQQVIDEAPDIAPYNVRLDELQQRLLAQQAAIDNALSKAESTFRVLVQDELQRQSERLRYYQSQARLALARLYDSSNETSPAEEEQ